MSIVFCRLRHMLLFLSILLVFISKSLSHLPEMSNETLAEYKDFLAKSQELYNYLFEEQNYNKNLSPVYTKTNNVYKVPRFNVDIILTYTRLLNIDPEAQRLSLLVQSLNIWTDLRLTWDPANYSQIDNIFVNAGEVWLPQNTLADSFTVTDVLQDYKRTVQIFANGTILYVSKVYVETICNLNLGHFPFDAQDCPIRFMVNSYPVNLVSSTGVYASFDVENRTSNSEWHATSIRTTPFLDTQASTPFESVIFYIHLKRVPQFYIYVIILPCSTLSVLSIIGMFWNENRVEQQLEKLSIGLTSLMSMTVLLDIVATSVPKTKVFPLLGIFVLICVFIIGVGCVVLVVAPVNEKNSTKRKNLTWKQKILAEISQRNFILHWFFQGANLINFVVTISFWR